MAVFIFNMSLFVRNQLDPSQRAASTFMSPTRNPRGSTAVANHFH